LIGDIMLHYNSNTIGILAFYIAQLVPCCYILGLHHRDKIEQIITLALVLLTPMIYFNAVYPFLIYTLLSTYNLSLSVVHSTEEHVLLFESCLMLALSDLTLLAQLAGYWWIQPITLSLYYISLLLFYLNEFRSLNWVEIVHLKKIE